MANNLEVSIKKPKDNERVDKETIEVKGTVTPVTEVKTATLAVNEGPPELLQIDEGKFSKKVTLREGANVIKVEAQDQQDKLWSKCRAVQYVKTEHSFWWGAGFIIVLLIVFAISSIVYLLGHGDWWTKEGSLFRSFNFTGAWKQGGWRWLEGLWFSFFAVLVREIFRAGVRMAEKRFTKESAFRALGTIIQAPIITLAFMLIIFNIGISVAGIEISLDNFSIHWLIALSVVASLFSYDTTEELRAVSRWLRDRIEETFEAKVVPVEVSITKPEEGEEVHEEKVEVKGKVTSKAKVTKATLTVNAENPVPLEVDAEGGFSKKEVELEEGWNIIEVEAQNEEGKTGTESIRVRYVEGGE